MSKKTAVLEPRHPKGVMLKDALEEDAPRLKAMKGLIDKKATLIKSSEDPAIAAELSVPENMRPTDEQLARINAYTRSTKTADEVVAFKTLSCNDLIDRDDDQFSTQCVKDFAALEQPFSPTGKSFMLDHAYSTQNAVGRIFGTDTKKVSGSQFLTNEVYMPNTEQFKPQIEKIDFGINWAVSVGVVLGKSACTVCQAPFGSYGWWCANGHDKGAYYDPNSEETDSWGYPLPCDPSAKGAVKCVRVFDNPVDMYELSQVFLGAQFFAAIDKDPEMKSVLKAMKGKVPIIGLSEVEARKLPLTHEPEKVSEARLRFAVEVDKEDGSLNWTDNNGVRFSFNPEEPEEGIFSLGKASTNKSEEDNDGNRSNGEEGQDGLHGEELAPGTDPLNDEDEEDLSRSAGEGSGQGGKRNLSAEGEQRQRSGSGGTRRLSADDEDEEDEDESEDEEEDSEEDDDSDSEDESDDEKGATKDSVLATARKAKVSDDAIKAIKAAKGSGLSVLLNVLTEERKVYQNRFEVLAPKAVLGDEYVEVLKSEAIDWYVKAHATKESKKVKTEAFEKKIAIFGSNVELLRAEIEEQRTLAQAKFPGSVRRSTFNDDPNKRGGIGNDDDEPAEIEDEDRTFDKKVQRIHG